MLLNTRIINQAVMKFREESLTALGSPGGKREDSSNI